MAKDDYFVIAYKILAYLYRSLKEGTDIDTGLLECGSTMLKRAIVLEADDIKDIIAEKYNVNPKDVIKSQYSYTVIINEKKEGENDGKISEIK